MQLAQGISLISDADGQQTLALQNQFCQAQIALQGRSYSIIA